MMNSGLIAALVMAAPLLGQEGSDRLTLNFSDQSRPGTVKVNATHSGIVVKTHAAKEVFIETQGGKGSCSRRVVSLRRSPPRAWPT